MVCNERFDAGKEEGPDFDYLLGMTMWSLTMERKDDLINKKNDKEAELNDLRMKTPGDLWINDLDLLVAKVSWDFI
jgi:DNA topoisomerase-2